jgi:amidase
MKYWTTTQQEVDFIISPVGPSAAPRHETARYWGYTAVFNLLDWPAYVFPTGETVSKELHPKDESYEPRDNEFDGYNWGNYEPSEFEGAPISFQLIGRKWQDELVVKAVGRLAAVLDLKDAGSLKN